MSEEKPLIVVVGDALVDLLTFVPMLPRRGGTVTSPPSERHPGGTGANVAAGLAALGEHVRFVGALGDDDNGCFVLDDLSARGIDTGGVVLMPGVATGVVIALIEPDGQRTFIAAAVSSSYTAVTDDLLQFVDREQPAAIYISGVLMRSEPALSMLPRFAARWRGRAPLYFGTCLTQLGPRQPQATLDALRAVAVCSDVVLTTGEEAALLGITPVEEQLFVLKRGVRGAALTGAKGEIASVPGHRVEVVDLLGAGDMFNAAFISARTRGLPVGAALAFANAAAALSIQHHGARAMPPWEDAARLAGLHP